MEWMLRQTEKVELPDVVKRGLAVAQDTEPSQRPRFVFGNGDLGPGNFIARKDGSVAVVDWENVGFNDPVSEIMLLHTWPEDEPFLTLYPVDRMYCDRAGLDASILPWYELIGALCGWWYATKDQNARSRRHHEQWLVDLLAQ